MDKDLNRLLKAIRTITVILIALVFSISSTVAGEKRVDVGAIIKDVMQVRVERKDFTLAMWLPNEFWEAALATQGRTTENATTELLDMLRPYIFFFLAKADVGQMGAPTFLSEPDLRRGVRFIDAAGNRYAPIPASELSPDISNMLEKMRPDLARSAGLVGEGIYPMVFPATDETGTRIADAIREGRFSLAITDQLLHWRTPLGSLVPPKKDPTTGEIVSGAWTYSPWTGVKLVPVEEQ